MVVNFLLRKINPIKFWKKKGMKIGTFCQISHTASFGSEPYLISIGNNVKISHNVHFITHDGGAHVLRNLKSEFKNLDIFKGRTSVGNNVFIGNRTTIMPGVSIGDNVVIGCDSVITKDVPANSVVVGVPGRVIETIDLYIEKNKKNFVNTKNLSNKIKKNILLEKYEKNRTNN